MTARAGLLVGMVVAIALVATALVIDEQREFEAAVDNLKDEQIAIATAVAADLETRLTRLEQREALPAAPSEMARTIPKLLGGALKLQQVGSRILLVSAPGNQAFWTTDGRQIHSDTLRIALSGGMSGMVLARDEAPHFGLPQRISIAGIDSVAARGGTWGVIVLASGERLRARERYAQLRFLLGLGLVIAIIAGFGGIAIGHERRQVASARALELSALTREREKLLARADKMATLAALSSGIAHEVATPLGTIMAQTEHLLFLHKDEAESSAALEVVLNQIERIQAIIRGVLGLARGEMPSFVKAHPRDIADAAASLSLHRFKQSGVALILDAEPELPCVACDPPMLEQAVTNLLLNACDASPPGARVHLSVQVVASTLMFVVDDEGTGIAADTAARAHEPFFTTKSGRGHGLGLAITREVVSHHGGSLRLEPRQDVRGTRATIELPAAAPGEVVE